MANFILPLAMQYYDFANWPTDSLKVVLVSSGYTYNSAHQNLSDVPVGDRIATAALTGAANTLGLLTALGVTFPSLSGSQVTQAFIYHDTGVAATSTLLVYINQGTGLPFTPDGHDLDIDWSGQGIAHL